MATAVTAFPLHFQNTNTDIVSNKSQVVANIHVSKKKDQKLQ